MKLAILSPVAWRTPPRTYGPWELIASTIAEGMVNAGLDVTLFATGDSTTRGTLESVISRGYEEDKSVDAKVAECLHISHLMEQAGAFDIIHNHFDFLPLTYSRLIKTPMVTTIHGFSSPKIIPVYKRYNDVNHYVSISDSDRSEELEYIATVYNGIDPGAFHFNLFPQDYLLFFGRIHHDKGCKEAIEIAKACGKKLVIAGLIQDENYYNEYVRPQLEEGKVEYAGLADSIARNDLLRNALALLHPINFNEPFGLSVAEAMFCGTPVIAFNRGSMPEIIENDKTGFLVENVDEAVKAVNNLSDINRAYCREYAVGKFGKDKMVADYLAVYNGILNG